MTLNCSRCSRKYVRETWFNKHIPLCQQKPEQLKGQGCLTSGVKYEKKVHGILRKCYIGGQRFNTQNESELGGASSKNDMQCNFGGLEDIGIEMKVKNTPDWMQCSIRYVDGQWRGTDKCKIPEKSKDIFDRLISELNLFENNVPPFMTRKMTHDEWLKEKKETKRWDDVYIDVPPDTISNLYRAKGCQYIQVSDGLGLYHTGEDPCGFGVPYFNNQQQIRIRTKIHSRNNGTGHCAISLIAACQPKRINDMEPSPYSLDDEMRLPPALIIGSPDDDNL